MQIFTKTNNSISQLYLHYIYIYAIKTILPIKRSFFNFSNYNVFKLSSLLMYRIATI